MKLKLSHNLFRFIMRALVNTLRLYLCVPNDLCEIHVLIRLKTVHIKMREIGLIHLIYRIIEFQSEWQPCKIRATVLKLWVSVTSIDRFRLELLQHVYHRASHDAVFLTLFFNYVWYWYMKRCNFLAPNSIFLYRNAHFIVATFILAKEDQKEKMHWNKRSKTIWLWKRFRFYHLMQNEDVQLNIILKQHFASIFSLFAISWTMNWDKAIDFCSGFASVKSEMHAALNSSSILYSISRSESPFLDELSAMDCWNCWPRVSCFCFFFSRLHTGCNCVIVQCTCKIYVSYVCVCIANRASHKIPYTATIDA